METGEDSAQRSVSSTLEQRRARDLDEQVLRDSFDQAGLWCRWTSQENALAKALQACPADLWTRNEICPPERTILLAATSKNIRYLLASMQPRLPARVKSKQLSDFRRVWSFRREEHIANKDTLVQGLMSGLPRMLKYADITVLEVRNLQISGESAQNFLQLLKHCGTLKHLDLEGNEIGVDGG